MVYKSSILALLALSALFLEGQACSRILFNREGFPVLAARTMDWMYQFHDFLLVNPRGQAMDGGLGNASSKMWISKYGSVSASVAGWLSEQVSSFTGEKFDFYRDGGTDAINEMGLGVHGLYLEVTQYPELQQKASRSGVTYLRWVRYIVDNFASVAEAVSGMKDIEIAGVKIIGDAPSGVSLGIHLALEDKTGDSAIIEIKDKLQIYHGRSQNYSVLTNDPPLPSQLENLKQYSLGRMQDLPGDTTSTDRFVRMSYYLSYMPTTSKDSDVLAGYLRSIIMASAVPQGAPDHESSGYVVAPTWWVSIMDFKQELYYWSWTLNPNVIWVDLAWLKRYGWFEAHAYGVLNPRKHDLAGDVSKRFKEHKVPEGDISTDWVEQSEPAVWQTAVGLAAVFSLFVIGLTVSQCARSRQSKKNRLRSSLLGGS